MLTYFVSESITGLLSSCLAVLELTTQVNLLFIQRKQSSWNQTVIEHNLKNGKLKCNPKLGVNIFDQNSSRRNFMTAANYKSF